MSTIKLTHNDIKAMINEAVKRTLSSRQAINEYRDNEIWPRPRKSAKWSPYKTNWYHAKQKPVWYDESEMTPFDEDAIQASVMEDVEDFKDEMKQIAAKAKDLMAWAQKKGARVEFIKKPLMRYIDTAKSQTRGYIENKSEETGEYPWDIVFAFLQMSPEEQDAEIEKYVMPIILDDYQNTYGTYQGEYNDAADHRNSVIEGIKELMEKYGNTNPAEMTYVELCEGLKEIKGFCDDMSGGWVSSGADNFFKKYGISDVEQNMMAEWRKRRNEAKKYDLGYMNGWNEKDYAEFDELKQLMKNNRTYRVGGHSTNRGDENTHGDIIDAQGNLIATYDWSVDSSD